MGVVCFWQIVLKNSKIAGLRKSRKCSSLAISAAARLCRIDTRASDRFRGNDVVSHLAAGETQFHRHIFAARSSRLPRFSKTNHRRTIFRFVEHHHASREATRMHDPRRVRASPDGACRQGRAFLPTARPVRLRAFGSTKYMVCASLSEATKGTGQSRPSNSLRRPETLAGNECAGPQRRSSSSGCTHL